jgi:hypothetical protein
MNSIIGLLNTKLPFIFFVNVDYLFFIVQLLTVLPFVRVLLRFFVR